MAIAALAASHEIARAQTLPDYVRCDVSAAVIGAGPSGLHGGAVGQLDDNLTPDLVLVDTNRILTARTDRALFRRGSCAEGITPGTVDVASPTAAALGGFNDDLNTDLGVTSRSPRAASVFFGDGLGGFMTGVTSVPLSEPVTVAIETLNLDGLPDLIVGDRTSVLLLLGRTDGMLTVATTLMLGQEQVKAVGIGDFNADGSLDVVAVDLIGDVRVFLQGPGDTFPLGATFNIGGSPNDMKVADPLTIGDFDGDFVPDLAFTTKDGMLRVFLTRPADPPQNLTFEDTTPRAAGSDPSSVGLSDLDGNGTLDAVVSDEAGNVVRFFLGLGDGLFADTAVSRMTGPAPNAVLLADVDDDRRADVITTNEADGSLTFFLSSEPPPTPTSTFVNSPTPTFDTPTPSSTPTETPTATPSISPTPTPSATPSVTQTGQTTRTATPTITSTPGFFEVQGEGCARIAGGGGGAADAMPLVVLGLLFALRRFRRP
jgi:hypothetical protein